MAVAVGYTTAPWRAILRRTCFTRTVTSLLSRSPLPKRAVVLARSRSGLNRLGILLLVGGVLLPSSMAYGHDPTCPHHAGNAAHPVDESRSVDGDHTEHEGGEHGERPGHPTTGHASHDDGSEEPGTEDCRCAGGLCALVFSPDRALPAAHSFTLATATEAVSRESVPTVGVGPGPDRLQPPATGPPPAI